MALRIKCNRCKAIITGHDECDAEAKFSMHVCKGMRSIEDMPMDILRKLANREITEEEAWKLVDTVPTPTNKKAAVLDILSKELIHVESLAKRIGSTKKSVQSIICGLRKDGHDILSHGSNYVLKKK